MSTETKRWRKVRKTSPRDLSPLPESIPTPYKKLRAPDDRAANCQDCKDRRVAEATAEGRTITPTRKWRKLKTTTKVTADELCKLFFERDILLDKLARRSDEVRGLRAALAAQ